MPPTLAKLDFRSMESIIAPAFIEPKAPKKRSHDEIVEEMLKVKDLLELQKFVDQSDEKCLADLHALMKMQNMKHCLVWKVLGVTYRIRRANQMRNRTLRLRIGAFYGNCLQNPRLYRELLAVQVPNKRPIFSEEQKKYLEEMYKIDTAPGKEKRIEMARELNAMCSGVERTQIGVYKWFKARRDVRGE